VAEGDAEGGGPPASSPLALAELRHDRSRAPAAAARDLLGKYLFSSLETIDHLVEKPHGAVLSGGARTV
jgi:hypothetical protein